MKAIGRVTAWCGASFLLLVTAAVSPAMAATADKTPGSTALTAMLPKGLTNCGKQTAGNLPAGLVGLSVSYSCSIPKLGKMATLFAYAFDNASDYAKSLVAYNALKNIVPSMAGNNCQVTVPTDFGVVPWHSSRYPTTKGQDVECDVFLTTGSGKKTTAEYIWTIPSKHVILEAVGYNSTSLTSLESWWKANSDKKVKASLAAVKGKQHASTLVNLFPTGATECTPQTRSVLPPGMVGVVLTNDCDLPKLGPQAVFYSYVFDNAQDYATSLAAYTSFKKIDPTTADNECPMAAGFGFGVTQWHNDLFPSRSGQLLECTTVALKAGGTNNVPDYIWTVPSENVLLEAAGVPGETMQNLDTWWTHNSNT
jgi:hypothetical protein